MIKIKEKGGWKKAKEEFDKGNRLWLAKPKKNGKYNVAIEIIKTFEKYKYGKEMMTYSQWDEKNGIYDKSFPTEWEGWNFIEYDFFILNKDEARPYFKKIMVDTLISNN